MTGRIRTGRNRSGRKLTGTVVLVCGLATMAIGATLAVRTLGDLYNEVAADPLDGPTEADTRGDAAEIVKRVGFAAVGFPIAAVGAFMLRGARRRGRGATLGTDRVRGG